MKSENACDIKPGEVQSEIGSEGSKDYRETTLSKIPSEFLTFAKDLEENITRKLTEMKKDSEEKINLLNNKLSEFLEKSKKEPKLTELTGKVISQEIKINQVSKDLTTTLGNYDKLISDNLKFPGIIGNFCKFKTLCEFITYSSEKTAALLNFKDKFTAEYSGMKKRFESILTQFNLQVETLGKNQILMCEKKIDEARKEIDKNYESLRDKIAQDKIEKENNLQQFRIEILASIKALQRNKNEEEQKIFNDHIESSNNHLLEKIQTLENEILTFRKEISMIQTKEVEKENDREKEKDKESSIPKRRKKPPTEKRYNTLANLNLSYNRSLKNNKSLKLLKNFNSTQPSQNQPLKLKLKGSFSQEKSKKRISMLKPQIKKTSTLKVKEKPVIQINDSSNDEESHLKMTRTPKDFCIQKSQLIQYNKFVKDKKEGGKKKIFFQSQQEESDTNEMNSTELIFDKKEDSSPVSKNNDRSSNIMRRNIHLKTIQQFQNTGKISLLNFQSSKENLQSCNQIPKPDEELEIPKRERDRCSTVKMKSVLGMNILLSKTPERPNERRRSSTEKIPIDCSNEPKAQHIVQNKIEKK